MTPCLHSFCFPQGGCYAFCFNSVRIQPDSPLLSRLGRGLLPLWLRGKPRQHHYRLQIRCEDRADMEQVLDLVNHTLQPAGLQPLQSLRPGRSGGRELVLNLHCTPPSVAIWCSSCIRWGYITRFAGSCIPAATPNSCSIDRARLISGASHAGPFQSVSPPCPPSWMDGPGASCVFLVNSWPARTGPLAGYRPSPVFRKAICNRRSTP